MGWQWWWPQWAHFLPQTQCRWLKPNKYAFLLFWIFCEPQSNKLYIIVLILHIFHGTHTYVSWKKSLFVKLNLEIINVISYKSLDSTEIWTLMRFSSSSSSSSSSFVSDRKKFSISLKIIQIVFWNKVMFKDTRNLVNMGRGCSLHT